MSTINYQAGQLTPWGMGLSQFTTAMPWVKPADTKHLIPLKINSLDPKKLQFVQLEGAEELSNPYTWTLTFDYEADYEGAFLNISEVGRQVIAINYAVESIATKETPSQTFQRVFTGYIWDIKDPTGWYYTSDNTTKVYRYKATVVPKLYCLNHHIDNRIFVDKTAKDIIMAIFKEHGFDESKDYNFDVQGLANSYKIPVCVQYQESDWAFIQRLLMKMGVYFYFEHALSESGDITHKARFTDKKPSGIAAAPSQDVLSKPYYFGLHQQLTSTDNYSQIGLFDLNAIQHSMLAAVTVDGYNYNSPSQSLLAQQSVKASGVQISKHPRFGHYYSQQGHANTTDGDKFAQVRRNQYEALQAQMSIRSNLPVYSLMQKFTISDDSKKNFKNNAWGYVEGDYYIYQTQFNISLLGAAGNGMTAPLFIMRCLPLDDSTPALCPYYNLTQAPVTQTKLTAVVVNGEGKYDEETIKSANTALTKDNLRNVYIAFTWDQQVRTNKQQALTPVPSYYYAPPGLAAAPMIGSNVLVEFAQFDDLPNIIGAQFSDKNPPYALSDDPAYETVLMRQTVDASQLDLINKIIFSDQIDSEMKKQMLSIVAPGAFSLTAANANNGENQAALTMGYDGAAKLGNKKASITFTESGDIEISGVNLVFTSSEKLTVNAKSDVNLQSDANIVFNATQGIEAKAATNFVVDAKANVNITATAQAQLSGTTTLIKATAELTNQAPVISSGP